ncbi:MAG: nucleotidyltransferase domain-containing protein [Verrucomicrobiota bacterium]|jgi:predicted nucleotidyltransferase|nr:nucleotidyltransferase domain-containing protein [Verrucomicrobiota bacterium]
MKTRAEQMGGARLAGELKALLSRAFGPRLSSVVLFGSMARGTETVESDVDTLVILEPFENYAAELRTALEAVYPLSVRLGRRVSVKPISLFQYRHGDTPILTAIRNEGIPA